MPLEQRPLRLRRATDSHAGLPCLLGARRRESYRRISLDEVCKPIIAVVRSTRGRRSAISAISGQEAGKMLVSIVCFGR